MSKKERSNEEIVIKTKKKKMTANEKRKLGMKIAGWIMAIVMIFGTFISIFGMLIYR